LSKPELTIQLRRRLLEKAARKLNNNSIIVVDDSDIIKPKATEMEGFAYIRDGSGKHKTVLGYKLINVAAVNSSEENECEITPMMPELYSNDIKIDSSKNILFDQKNEIQVASGNKGIFTCDRYYDDKKTFKELSDNDADFIIRANNTRKLIYQGKYIHFMELVKAMKLDISVTSTDGTELEAGAIRVEIPVDPYLRKNPNTVSVWLMGGRYIKKPRKRNKREYDSTEKGGYFYLYTSIRHLNNDRESIILKGLSGYRLRWKIEEFHRYVKQDFGWEKMQLMDYTRLKNMNLLLLAALFLIYNMYDLRMTLLRIFPGILYDRKRDMKRIVFIYYRIPKIVNYLSSNWKLMVRKKYKGRYAESLQLKIKFK
jgi:Transposase DDE domain